MASSTKRKSSKKQAPELQELLVLELQEIHSAENQLAKMIPRLAKAAESEQLQSAIEERLKEGEQIIEDVEMALEELEATPGRKKNVAAEGLINDIREHMQEIETGPALDAVLIASLQKTEHYCIAAWGTAKAMGQACEQEELANAMDRALDEGGGWDERLTQLAEEEIMPAMLSGSDQEGAQSAQAGSSTASEGSDDEGDDEGDEESGEEVTRSPRGRSGNTGNRVRS